MKQRKRKREEGIEKRELKNTIEKGNREEGIDEMGKKIWKKEEH